MPDGLLQIGLVVFAGVQQLDLTGPYEVFASMKQARVHLIGRTMDPVTSSTGLRLMPTVSFEECPPLDIVCIPGGVGVNALMQDEEALAFVRRLADGARYVTSVCTGALVLGAAGLLHGKRATTHWGSHDLLAAFGATPVRARVVRDGNLITGGGVTAGIDFALVVVAELVGQETAEGIQLALEYAPEPPFQAGSPETSPSQVLAAVRARSTALRSERERIIREIGSPPT